MADVTSLNNIAVANNDLRQIMQELSEITEKNIQEIYNIYGKTLEEQHLKNKPLYDYRNMKFVGYENNNRLKAIAMAYAKTTGETMFNLTATQALCTVDRFGKVVSLSETYIKALDTATFQVASSSRNFTEAVRDTIKELGGSGIRVKYDSSATRNVDSMVRQSVLWGAKQASTEYMDEVGEELGCDGIEIDWHSNPRPSHEFMQGRQYVLGRSRTINGKYYESANEALERLQDYGCLHFKTPIICGVSEPLYNEEEIEKKNEENSKKYKINGKEYSGYESKQMMRRLENAIRAERRTQVLANEAGDNKLVNDCKRKIKAYRTKYKQISDITGIPTDIERMSVPRKPKT